MTRTTPVPDAPQIVVWIVDDNREFADNLAELVNRTDNLTCPRILSSAEEVLGAVEAGDIPDLVLMDIGLPGINGIEGIRKLKSLAPIVNVVMLTVLEDNDTIFRSISAGASGYLHKSAPLQEIITALRSIVTGGAPVNPHIARKILTMFSQLQASRVDHGLTAREHEVLQLLVDGLSKKRIAEKLNISFHTVDGHLRNIYAKLQVNTRSSAVAKALKERMM